MGKKGRKPQGREMKPTFFVFCEGETEAKYAAFLKSAYRVPIEISIRVARLNISESYINKYKQAKSSHPKDQSYLIYDLDVIEVNEKLRKIGNAKLLGTSPCFELWYLLHLPFPATQMSTKECIEKLEKEIPEYKKGEICASLSKLLSLERLNAVAKAKKLVSGGNPSSDMYILVEELEKLRGKK